MPYAVYHCSWWRYRSDSVRIISMKRYVISRDGVIICQTDIPYPALIMRDMKANGYRIKEVKCKDNILKGDKREQRI